MTLPTPSDGVVRAATPADVNGAVLTARNVFGVVPAAAVEHLAA